MTRRRAQYDSNVHQTAIIGGGVVHINSWWGYDGDVVCGLVRLGVGVAQLGGIGGVVGGNRKLVLLHVVLGNERCV